MSVALDIDHLRQWIGRTETARDLLTARMVRELNVTLDLPAGDPQPGDEAPIPTAHWCLAPPAVPLSGLGPDGHPARGGFLPPVPLPRRMWAGGRLRFRQPLRIGETVNRVSEILAVTEKSGRQGALVFLTVRHSLSGAEGLAIEEEQDIVYRAPSVTQTPAPVAETAAADWRKPRDPDPVLLFRYSALTFNGHRIHYDLPYAMGEEGYPGLVVQGPLTATLLIDAYQQQTGQMPRSFSFRGQAPLFAGGRMQLCGRASEAGHDLWAEGPGGYTAMSAQVTA